MVEFFKKIKENKMFMRLSGKLRTPLAATLLAALGVTLFTEITNRRSIIEAFAFMFSKFHFFVFNFFIVFFILSFSLLFKKRKSVLLLLSIVWVAFGVTDFILRCSRITPFAATDFALIESVWTIVFLYFELWQIILCSIAIVLVIALVVFLFVKMKKEKVDFKVAACSIAISALLLFGSSSIYHHTGMVPDHFSSLPDAYDAHGFSYCFTVGLFDRGVDRPEDYSKENVDEILNSIGAHINKENKYKPNIIFVQLESFFDVNYLSGISFSEDPVKNFSALKKNHTNGFLTVPSIGSGTANTEFEVLTGMNLDFFGTAEYPYKTILQDQTCETIAYNLREQGYFCHAVHNHTGDFYDRNFVYSHLGFDTFISVEYMQDVERNEIGWAKDSVLTGEIINALDSTKGQDLVYAISVQPHGRYPTEQEEGVSYGPITLHGFEDESKSISWQYFVNQVAETDAFVGELVSALSERDEECIVVFFGDHLPSISMEEEDLSAGNLYQTEYVMWSSFEMAREVKDLESYQLSSYIMSRAGFSNGIFTKLHQNYSESENYLDALEMLEYDVLYGDYDAYSGKQKYLPTPLRMGVLDISVSKITLEEGILSVEGDNFTENSVIVVGKRRYDTEFVSKNLIRTLPGEFDVDDEMPGSVSVAQITKNGVMLSSVTYSLPQDVPESTSGVK